MAERSKQKRRARRVRAVLAASLALPFLAGEAAGDDWFEILELPAKGRTVAANVADLDGDGRPDLFTVVFRGLPPDEQREIHVRFQRADAGFGLAADAIVPLPRDAAFHDFGVLEPGGPSELLFLRSDRVSRLSLPGRKPRWREIALGGPSLAIAPDERGLDRLLLVREGLVPGGPVLTVPGLGEILLVRPSGAIVARLAAPGRANYFIPPRPGPLLAENELEVYLDHPRTSIGDVDGDGLTDLIATTRHAIRVFRQRAGGEFAAQPSRTIPLGRISRKDHVRGSGSVRVETTDLDRDGRVDLLVTHTAEGLLDARSETTLHYNRGGEWNLAEPDQRFATKGSLHTEEVRDLDGDGRPELISVRVPLGVLELAEILVTRSIDAHLVVHVAGEGGLPFAEKPAWSRKLSLGFSFETFRSRGFLGNAAGDWNGDGLADLLLSGDGKALEIHRGEPGGRFAKRAERQPLDTNGRVALGHLDDDGLTDFVIFEPRRPDTPVRVGRNLGRLPGTPRAQTLQAPPGEAD